MKKSRFLSLVLTLSVLAALFLPVSASALEEPALNCTHAVLLDANYNEVLYEKGAYEKAYPASITKVMTALLVLEAIQEGKFAPDTPITASASAAQIPEGSSTANIKAGEVLTVEQLLYCLLLPSANEAAQILAEAVDGDQAAFVEHMNQRAKELGCQGTHFVNVHGFHDPNHYTTAYDIALMSRELILHHPDIRTYTTIWMDTLRDGTFQLANTNKLIRFYDGATGLKTGSTDSAKYCLSATAEREGMELIAVVLKSPTGQQRFEDAKALLNYGFSTYALLHTVPEEPFPAIPVVLGETETVQPCIDPQKAVALVQKSQAGGLSQSVTLAEQVEAPVSAGQELGTLTLTDAAGETVQSIPIRAAQSVERLTFGTMLRRMLSAAFFAG